MIKKYKEWIKKYEGFNSYPYLCTSEKITIGYGRNLQDQGITQEEAEFLFENDVKNCEKELSNFVWYREQPEPVRAALINMCFNMGITRLKKFKRMIAALEDKNYTLAAQEALNSLWASQVGKRAKDVALMIRESE